MLVVDPTTGLLKPQYGDGDEDVALFVRVHGRWRFEGVMDYLLFMSAVDVIKERVETDNGPGSFWSVQLPLAP